MEVVTTKALLLQAVSLPQSISLKKSTMPILQNILLHVQGHALLLSASDLEIAAVTKCDAEINRPGSIAVNGRLFGDVVRELPEGEVTLSVADDQIEVRSQKTRLRLSGVHAAEYPSLKGVDLEVSGRVKASDLVQMLNQTLYATSADETRFSLNGALLEGGDAASGSTIKFVATDGHRLSVTVRPSSGVFLSESVIIPKKGLAEVRKSLELEGDKEVGLAISENYLVLETSQAKVAIRVIDGEYPDYRVVIPKSSELSFLIPIEEFSRAIRRAILMASDDEHKVICTVSPGMMRMDSASRSRGEATEEMIIHEFSGAPFSIAFNPRYLLDAVTSFGGRSRLRISLPSEAGPAVLSPEDDDASFAVVMPMRVDD